MFMMMVVVMLVIMPMMIFLQMSPKQALVHKGFQIPHHPLTQADKIPTNGSGQSIPVPGIANDTKVSNTTTKILPQQGMMNIHSDSMQLPAP